MLADQHFTVIVLLEYIDLFTGCMIIMLGKDYSVNIMLNALPSSQLNWNVGHKPTYPTSLRYYVLPYHILFYYKTMALTVSPGYFITSHRMLLSIMLALQ